MNIFMTISTPQKERLPFLLIFLLTILFLIVSIIALVSGWQTIFLNQFNFPIILTWLYHVRPGVVFPVFIACSYFVLITIFSNDPGIPEDALVQVSISILVAGVMTYLSVIRIQGEDALKKNEEFNRGLVKDISNQVVVSGPDRETRYVNPASATMPGYSAVEIVGTVMMTYLAFDQHAEIEKDTDELFSSGKGNSLDIGISSRAGQHHAVVPIESPLDFRDHPGVLFRLVNEIPPGMTRFADHLIVTVFFHLMDNAMRYHGKIPFIRFSADEQMRNKMAIT